MRTREINDETIYFFVDTITTACIITSVNYTVVAVFEISTISISLWQQSLVVVCLSCSMYRQYVYCLQKNMNAGSFSFSKKLFAPGLTA